MKTYFLIITVTVFTAIAWNGPTPTAWGKKQTRTDVRTSEFLPAFLTEYEQAKQQVHVLQQDSASTWYIESVDTCSVVQ